MNAIKSQVLGGERSNSFSSNLIIDKKGFIASQSSFEIGKMWFNMFFNVSIFSEIVGNGKLYVAFAAVV